MLDAETSLANLTLPRTIPWISLHGRQSKVIVTDYTFGASSLLYSTASIFFAGRIGSRDIIFFYGDSDQNHEIALELTGRSSTTLGNPSSVRISREIGNIDTVTISAGFTGLLFLWESDTQVVLFSDPAIVSTFWAPIVPGVSALPNYWQYGSNETILVGGPYLVRNSTINATALYLTGDLNSSVPITVLAPDHINSVFWNGVQVSVKEQNSVLTGQLTMKELKSTQPPVLDHWRFADSLPEIQAQFSDTDWIIANHTTTNIIIPPSFGDGRVLYGMHVLLMLPTLSCLNRS